jgi:predicted dehydrogenase
MKVGIVGCGLIGGKRADALVGTEDRLVATFDLVPERARALAAKHKAEACATLDELVARSEAVVIAATNDQLTPLSTLAVRAGKHVVVEKPAARSARELEPPLRARARQRRRGEGRL